MSGFSGLTGRRAAPGYPGSSTYIRAMRTCICLTVVVLILELAKGNK
ncbi:hypothetical protein [Streptomyces sp. NPDC053720]